MAARAAALSDPRTPGSPVVVLSWRLPLSPQPTSENVNIAMAAITHATTVTTGWRVTERARRANRLMARN